MDLYTIRQKLSEGIPLTKLNLRVVSYSRVSTDHKEQYNSLINQIDYFKEYINNNPSWIYVDSYFDNGISGTTDKRSNFMHMITDAKTGKFDLIITKEISRFSRNTLDSIKYTRTLLEKGVAVYFINDNINTALPDSELRLTIMASMAQDEIRRLSERVKFGIKEAINKGHFLGPSHIYGYKKTKENGKLSIIKEEASIIKKIYNMYAIENISLNKIVTYLNTQNILTTRGNKWCVSTISNIIKNPKYKGYFCKKKTERIDFINKKVKKIPKEEWLTEKDKNIPSIVNEKIWEKANKKLSTQNSKHPSINYPLSSKIYCSNDNCLYYRRVQCKKSDDITWVCSKYLKEGKKSCSTANIREREIYNIFNNLLKILSVDKKEIINKLNNLYNSYYPKIKEKNHNYNQIKRLQQKKEKLIEMKLENLISKEEFIKLQAKYNNEIKKIEHNKKLNNQINFNYKIPVTKLINDKKTTDKLITMLLNKVIAHQEKDTIYLKMYINYPHEKKSNNINLLAFKKYSFKRGYNTRSTRRYIVDYKVYFYTLIDNNKIL